MPKQEPDNAHLPAGSAAPEDTTQPRQVVLCGRGVHGKSWLARWAGGRAIARGREVVIADADRTNPTLSAYFGAVVGPPSSDEADMRDWYADLVERKIKRLLNLILDLG